MMCKIILLLSSILLLNFKYLATAWQTEESRLRKHLLNDYEIDLRPVKNATTVTNISVSMSNVQIMGLDEQNQIILISASIVLIWKDEFLTWNPENFSNQSRIVFSNREIWTPDIVLFNSADVLYSTDRDNYLIDVQSDGRVTWIFPEKLKSHCSVNIQYFPFDKQVCHLEFQSWSRTMAEIQVYNGNENPMISHSSIHTEWKLSSIISKMDTHNNYQWIDYTLSIQRNHAFYVNHIIIPFFILTLLTLFVFWLPPDSVTMLLTLTLFLQLITEYTPKAAKSLPIIGIYFNFNLLLILISVVLTIVVLNFHFRGPKRHRVPKLWKKLIINRLGYILRITHHETPKKGIKNAKPTSKELNEVNSNSNSNRNDIKSKSQLNDSFEIMDETAVSAGDAEEVNKLKNQSNCKIVASLHDLISSFDVTKLKNNDLKIAILKEILQSQINLINMNEKRQLTRIEANLNEIYDEWKILAIITDRACFFIYLITLVSSTLFFFVYITFNK